MGQGNGNGKFEIKMLPSHGWKRVLRPLRAQLLHNLMGSERKLPVSNRQVALQKALKILLCNPLPARGEKIDGIQYSGATVAFFRPHPPFPMVSQRLRGDSDVLMF